MMMNTGMLTKDLGTILVGKQAVEEGIINEVGGIDEAMKKLHEMIDENKQNNEIWKPRKSCNDIFSQIW